MLILENPTEESIVQALAGRITEGPARDVAKIIAKTQMGSILIRPKLPPPAAIIGRINFYWVGTKELRLEVAAVNPEEFERPLTIKSAPMHSSARKTTTMFLASERWRQLLQARAIRLQRYLAARGISHKVNDVIVERIMALGKNYVIVAESPAFDTTGYFMTKDCKESICIAPWKDARVDDVARSDEARKVLSDALGTSLNKRQVRQLLSGKAAPEFVDEIATRLVSKRVMAALAGEQR